MTTDHRILIYGAGAIGSFIGALLAQSGANVTLLARGAHADAMSARAGLMLREPGSPDRCVPLRACRRGETEGPYDIIFATLKSTQIAEAAADMMQLLSPDGALVMVQNGLPWWYFDGIDHPLRGTALRSLDPDGVLSRTIDLQRVVGAVIYRPAAIVEPGVLSAPSTASQRLVIGEPDGRKSQRCALIESMLVAGGLPVEVTSDIRAAKWQKLQVNMLWNPLTALSQGTPGDIAAFAPAHGLVQALLGEGAAVAASVGVWLPDDAQAELRRAAENFTPPSMLQDVRAGRRLELDAIVNAVVEIAALRGVPVPTLKTVALCASLLDRFLQHHGTALAPAART